MLWYIMLVFSIFNWSQNSKGNQFYQNKQYPEALDAYREAQKRTPESPVIHYNTGNTLYRQGKFKDAAQEYRQATEGGAPLNARACYNLGNSLYRNGQLQDAVEAYKRALRITPHDVDAKYNLEFVQRQLQDKQQPPPSSENDDKEDSSKNQQNKKDPSKNESKPDQSEQQPSQQQDRSRDNKNQNMNPSPPPQPGDMSREEAERLLNALNKDEQDLQKRLRKQRPAQQENPGKDW